MNDIRELTMEAIRRRLGESSLGKDRLVDFDSSGYGPSAIGRLWNYVDELVHDNRLMRLHLNKIKPLSEKDWKRIRFFETADKKLEGIDDQAERERLKANG